MHPQVQVNIRRDWMKPSRDGDRETRTTIQHFHFRDRYIRKYNRPDELTPLQAQTAMHYEIKNLNCILSFKFTFELNGGESRFLDWSEETRRWYMETVRPVYRCLTRHFRGNHGALLTLYPGYCEPDFKCKCIETKSKLFIKPTGREFFYGYWDLLPKADIKRKYFDESYWNGLPFTTWNDQETSLHPRKQGEIPKPDYHLADDL